MTKKTRALALSATLVLPMLLAACQRGPDNATQTAPLTKAQRDEAAITNLCNEVAAELVANPGSQAPLLKLRQRHMEEEWSFADVDRICSAAIARKTKLMYGAPSPDDHLSRDGSPGQTAVDLERLADEAGNEVTPAR